MRSHYLRAASESNIGSAVNPAVNGQEIKNAGRPSGWYYIQTSSMSSSQLIYVNNDDLNGGWMLISYHYDTSQSGAPGSPAYPNYFTVNSLPQSFTNLTVSTDAYKLWYHNSSANVSQILQMYSNTGNLTPLLTNITTASRIEYSNPSAFVQANITGTGSTAYANNFQTTSSLTGTWYNVKGRSNMLNAGQSSLAVRAPCDWLYSTGGSFYWQVCDDSSNYSTSTDGRSGSALGTGSWINVANSDFYGGNNITQTGNAQNPNNKTFAYYLK